VANPAARRGLIFLLFFFLPSSSFFSLKIEGAQLF
jgi:hypothetical protein